MARVPSSKLGLDSSVESDVFTDSEIGIVIGARRRLDAEADHAQALINHVHGQLQAERAAHRRTVAALTDAQATIRQLQRHLQEVDAALAG